MAPPGQPTPSPLISTNRLLRLSEGLYLINALQERQALQKSYDQLAELTKPATEWYQEIGQPFAACLKTALPAWQKLFPATTPFPLQGEIIVHSTFTQIRQQLDNLPWYKRLFFKSHINTLRQTALIQGQEIFEADEKFKSLKRWPWSKMLTDTSNALTAWLKFVILRYLPVPEGLTDRASIMLGVIFIYAKPEPLDATWLENQQLITTAFKQSKILDWANGGTRQLKDWENKQVAIKLYHQLCITPAILTQDQKSTDWQYTPEKLQADLKVAYATIQPQIKPLALIFTALQNPNLTTKIDAILTQGNIKPDCHQQAITSLICGTSHQDLTTAISKWLDSQKDTVRCFDIPTAIARTKRRFERISQIYPLTWPHTDLDEQVNAWTGVLLQETGNDAEKLWEILERSRIAFISTTRALNYNAWAEQTCKALKDAFAESIHTRQQRYPANEPWPPLTTWLQAVDKLIPQNSSITDCQRQLTNSALIQLFFDAQNNLQALWLDQHNLEIRTLPEFNLDISRWNAATDTLGKKTAADGGELNQAIQAMQAIMAELHPIAQILSEWAHGLEHITVIFPAPLGQLPWETLPELENILVRAISVATWLEQMKSSTAPLTNHWIVCDYSAALQCTIKEALWLAKHYQVPEDSPHRFEAIQKFGEYQHIHLTAHGNYEPNDPTASSLTLSRKENLPLWMLNVNPIKADLIVLSACESNLTGEPTTAILKPIGIGPNLIAAGGKTVVGTLWAYNGLAALCFSYHFYQIAELNPTMPWHIVATQARQAVRAMQHADLEHIIQEFELKDESDPCWEDLVESIYGDSWTINEGGGTSKPFSRFDLWAGFIVLGKVARS